MDDLSIFQLGGQSLIPWLIVGVLIIGMLLVFGAQLKVVSKLLMQGALGSLGFVVFNNILAGLGVGLMVGINLITVVVVSLLGLPGFVMLYVSQLVL